MDKSKTTSLVNIGLVSSFLVGIFIATYLTLLKLVGGQPLCGSSGCHSWYMNGPLSTVLGIPLPLLGLCIWLLLLIGILLEAHTYVKITSLLFALLVVGFLIIGIIQTQTVCLWCLAHSISCIAFASVLLLNDIKSTDRFKFLVGTLFSVLFGIISAIITPTSLTNNTFLAEAILTIDARNLLDSGVEVIPKSDNSSSIIAIVDLNCDHCKSWLSRVCSTQQKPNANLYVVWSKVDSIYNEGAHRDNNAIADQFAGNINELRNFFSGGCKGRHPSAIAPLPDRAVKASKLFHQLNINTTPNYLLMQDSEPIKLVNGYEAYEFLFKRSN